MGDKNAGAAAMRVSVRGRQWTVSGQTPGADCTAVRLNEIGGDRAQTLLIPFDRLRPIDGRPRPRLVRPRRWLHDLDRARLQLHPFGGCRAAAHAPLRLLPYQLEPAIAVIRDGVSRVLIADKVGLGKTIQAGLIVLELSQQHDACRALVLVPAGLREQWIAELRLRLGLEATFADSAWIRTARNDRPAHVNPWSLPGIYVASCDLVKRPEVLRALEDVSWDVVVVDEAHTASSRSDRHLAVHAIAGRARHVVLLSATPNNGDPAEFAALCEIGKLGGDPSPLLLFERTRAAAGEHRPRKTVVVSVTCTDHERRMHALLRRYCSRLWDEAGRRGDERARLVAIVLRKRALSSAASLAASVERRLTLLSGSPANEPRQLPLPLPAAADEEILEDDEPIAGLAAPGLADANSERRWLTNVAAIAHEAALQESKTRFLLRLLARLRRHGSTSALIFTEYRDTLARLLHRIAVAGHEAVVLHGGLTAAERSTVQHTFNERGGILLATDAAAEGLNLHQRCHLVIHYELPWNPARLEQRCGRVDRFGQTARVHELALVAEHTAERLVIAPLLQRSRGTGPRQGAMLVALTESRVASAVMDGEETAADAGEPAALPASVTPAPADLAASAIREVARLEETRRLIRRSHRCPAGQPKLPISTLRRSTNPAPRLVLFLALEVRDSDGVVLHGEPLAVRVDFASGRHDASAPEIETRLLEVLSDLSGRSEFLGRHAAPRAAATLEQITRLEALRRHRDLQRRQAMHENIQRRQLAASRILVQQGLFDRRAARAAVARADRQTRQLEGIDERRATTSGPLSLRTEVIAALLVPERR
jgi:superfamily II DNA or RNA helicase